MLLQFMIRQTRQNIPRAKKKTVYINVRHRYTGTYNSCRKIKNYNTKQERTSELHICTYNHWYN